MKELFWNKKFILLSLLIALAYLIVTTYLMNVGLVSDTLLGDYPLTYKWNLMVALLGGMWTAMTRTGLLLLIATGILTGANIVLVFQRVKTLRSSGKLGIAVGGSSVLGIVGSGCATCGLPILALLGFSGSLAFLPFRGTELSWLSIILLGLSFYLLVKSYLQSQVCKVEPNK